MRREKVEKREEKISFTVVGEEDEESEWERCVFWEDGGLYIGIGNKDIFHLHSWFQFVVAPNLFSCCTHNSIWHLQSTSSKIFHNSRHVGSQLLFRYFAISTSFYNNPPHIAKDKDKEKKKKKLGSSKM